MKTTRPKFALIVLATLALLAASGLTAAVELETRDAFCASCHTEPESTYYARSLELPADLASTHAFIDSGRVRCIDCHSGEGALGRARSLSQGAWDLIHYLSGRYAQPAVSTNPVGDPGCVKCHLPRLAANALFVEGMIASRSHYHLEEYLQEWMLRRPQLEGSCAFCHVAHSEGASAGDHFSLPADIENGCDTCHSALSGWNPPE